jgi:hypothetical protein
MDHPQSWVEATKIAKEAQHVVSSQTRKPSFIPHPKSITPTPPSTPLKIKKLTWAEMDENQLKGLCYNCDEKYFPGNKSFLWPFLRIFFKKMSRLPIWLSHLNPLT